MDVFYLRERPIANYASYVRSFINIRDHRIGEAVENLGVSGDTLRRWDLAGKLTARRHSVSRRQLYVRKELDALFGQVAEMDKADGSSGQAKRKGVKRRAK